MFTGPISISLANAGVRGDGAHQCWGSWALHLRASWTGKHLSSRRGRSEGQESERPRETLKKKLKLVGK